MLRCIMLRRAVSRPRNKPTCHRVRGHLAVLTEIVSPGLLFFLTIRADRDDTVWSRFAWAANVSGSGSKLMWSSKASVVAFLGCASLVVAPTAAEPVPEHHAPRDAVIVFVNAPNRIDTAGIGVRAVVRDDSASGHNVSTLNAQAVWNCTPTGDSICCSGRSGTQIRVTCLCYAGAGYLGIPLWFVCGDTGWMV